MAKEVFSSQEEWGVAGGNAGREGAGMLFLKDKIEKEREKDRRKGMDRESKRAFFHGKL